MTDITLKDDRLLVHEDGEILDIPLAYQIHSRLIQTGELARLLAEHLRDEGGERLPPPGRPVRLALPTSWGLVRLQLPITGLQDLQQPMHHLAWELDLHAPDQAEQYVFDYQEFSEDNGNTGQPGLRLIAVRQNLVQFCRTLCEELGWKLVALRAEDEEAQDFHLDLLRAAAHRDALAAETFPPVRSWRLAVGAALAVALLGVGAGFLLRPAAPTTPPAPVAPVPAPSADSLKAALALRSQDSSRTAAPPDSIHATAPSPAGADTAWARLLAPLAEKEAELPDFFVMDGTGILVRQEEGGRGRFTRILQRPARVSRVSPGFYWVDFTRDLPGGLLAEDTSRPVRRLKLARLQELAAQLREAPSRVLVQRRRAGSGTLWRFDAASSSAASQGWQVTIVPGQQAPRSGGR